jgi:copper chaperone CopZ
MKGNSPAVFLRGCFHGRKVQLLLSDLEKAEMEMGNMIKTILKIDGMMCAMCEAHICEAIRKAVPSAKRVSASRSKNEASFLTAEAVDADRLKAAVNATGYTCLGIESVPYEKKGLFGRI